MKRKKEKERKDEKKQGKREFKVKYIGETGRSGYERGVEHVRDFENCEETSHLLKHYLMFHKDVKKSDMRFGMRIRSSFRSPIERQIGEAIAIDRENRKGTVLMNSKSEYNRCQIARITTLSKGESKKEIEKEAEEEKIFKEEIKEIRRKKREKKIEREEKLPKNKRRKYTENKIEEKMAKIPKMPEKEAEKSEKTAKKMSEKSTQEEALIQDISSEKMPKLCLKKSDQISPKKNPLIVTPLDAGDKVSLQAPVEMKLGLIVKSDLDLDNPTPLVAEDKVSPQVPEEQYLELVVKSPKEVKTHIPPRSLGVKCPPRSWKNGIMV